MEYYDNWRYIKPNGFKEMWEKGAKQQCEERFIKKGVKGRAQYNLFRQCNTTFLNLLFERAIEYGEEIKIPYFGTICARQVRHTNFRSGRYARNFEQAGGREYTIFDLMKKGNKYPIITFLNNGNMKSRSVYWRSYIMPSTKWRRRLYQKFYDEGFEYRTHRYLTEDEWKRKQAQVIWRNGMIIK